MSQIWTALVEFVSAGLNLIGVFLGQFLVCAVPLFFLLWALFAIDWRKLRPVLVQGGAIPLVMLAFLIVGVWGGIAPATLNLVGFDVPNFIWQGVAVGVGVGLLLFCGWLQERAGWFPHEVELFPVAAHGHDHHGGHGHH